MPGQVLSLRASAAHHLPSRGCRGNQNQGMQKVAGHKCLQNILAVPFLFEIEYVCVHLFTYICSIPGKVLPPRAPAAHHLPSRGCRGNQKQDAQQVAGQRFLQHILPARFFVSCFDYIVACLVRFCPCGPQQRTTYQAEDAVGIRTRACKRSLATNFCNVYCPHD